MAALIGQVYPGMVSTKARMPAKTISHYEILELLGEGGMGTVYRALDTRLDRSVAVKLLRGDGPTDGDRRKRFVQEARAASALNHPHIITIYDIGQDGGVDFIAMEYVAGPSLASVIRRGRLETGQALKYAIQVADALAAAHAAGIIHRDLKPSNVLLTGTGSVKVLDFGLAKLIESAASPSDEHVTTARAGSLERLQTDEGTILGTAAYMSPEQAEGKRADTRSDVFSFGALLYEMVTGRRAFPGDTKVATLAAILATEPEPPSRVAPELPRDLERLIARCLRKDPERRWQSMADVKVALEELRDEPESGRAAEDPSAGASRRPTRRSSVAVASVIVAIGAVAFSIWWSASRRVSSPQPSLVRLTSDVGWTDHPAISPDGKILAYASDRSGEGNLDIWIQQIPDGSPVRLTRDAADDVDPSFSADGSRIAFQSSRAGGGTYVVPTLGGEARLLAERAFSPRFSPDGKWVAYGRAEALGSRIYVAPATGGPAAPVTADFYLARAPVWSPDGHDLLFWGQRDRDAPPEHNVDWWVVPATGGPAVRTDARSVLLREGFQAFHGLPTPDGWVGTGDRVVFHGRVGDSSNIWQLAVSSATWRVRGAPQRVTFGTTDEGASSVTRGGRIVFSSRTNGEDIWSLPIDAGRGEVRGVLSRVTQDLASDDGMSLSADGRMLAFRSRRAGQFDIFLKDLATGQETTLTQSPTDDHPAISPDGTKVAYSFRQNGETPIFVAPSAGGSPELVCRDCGEVEQWAPGGREILFVTGEDPSSIGLLTLGASARRNWLTHARFAVFSARLAPDGEWVSFNGRPDRFAPARVFVARVDGSVVAGEQEWIVVAEEGDVPRWSPDAGLLYFWSNRDGSPCLWAQRLDPASKRPTGSPLNVHHFHNRGLSWRNLYLGAAGMAVAQDTIVFNLGEHIGSIWMTDLPRIRE